MKKNGWFFGDSFTSGFGLNFDHEINGMNVSHNKFNAPLIDQIPNHLWDNIPYVNFKNHRKGRNNPFFLFNLVVLQKCYKTNIFLLHSKATKHSI